MNAQQKLKHLILLRHADFSHYEYALPDGPINAKNIDSIWDAAYEDGQNDNMQDAHEEIRGGEVETQIDCGWSRHYELKSVAARYLDGSWIGWTYVYGGGKHSNPSEVEWVSDAYDLNCKEQEKVITVREFTKVAP